MLRWSGKPSNTVVCRSRALDATGYLAACSRTRLSPLVRSGRPDGDGFADVIVTSGQPARACHLRGTGNRAAGAQRYARCGRPHPDHARHRAHRRGRRRRRSRPAARSTSRSAPARRRTLRRRWRLAGQLRTRHAGSMGAGEDLYGRHAAGGLRIRISDPVAADCARLDPSAIVCSSRSATIRAPWSCASPR